LIFLVSWATAVLCTRNPFWVIHQVLNSGNNMTEATYKTLMDRQSRNP
jgi:hypothetical protein